MIETLEVMRRHGFVQSILTNKPESVTLPACDRLGLTNRLDGIWGGLPDRPLKPHPDSLNVILSHFDCHREACAMIGDYRADHEVAEAVGTRMIGVTWGLFNREQTLNRRPDAVIDSMAELPALFSIDP